MRYLVAATGERDACCLTVPITDRLNTRVRGEIADDIVNVRVCGGVGVYPRVEQNATGALRQCSVNLPVDDVFVNVIS